VAIYEQQRPPEAETLPMPFQKKHPAVPGNLKRGTEK